MLTGLLYLLPALALAGVLLTRRYPGERTLLALRGSRSPRWARPRSSIVRSRPAAFASARGGLLIARSLAVRPPPAFRPAS